MKLFRGRWCLAVFGVCRRSLGVICVGRDPFRAMYLGWRQWGMGIGPFVMLLYFGMDANWDGGLGLGLEYGLGIDHGRRNMGGGVGWRGIRALWAAWELGWGRMGLAHLVCSAVTQRAAHWMVCMGFITWVGRLGVCWFIWCGSFLKCVCWFTWHGTSMHVIGVRGFDDLLARRNRIVGFRLGLAETFCLITKCMI